MSLTGGTCGATTSAAASRNPALDIVFAGHGDDSIRGGPHGDRLKGGHDDDTIYGGAGGDGIVGNAGSDVIFCGAMADLVLDGRGVDTIYGGLGNDGVILTDDGTADTVTCGPGQDVVWGATTENTVAADCEKVHVKPPPHCCGDRPQRDAPTAWRGRQLQY